MTQRLVMFRMAPNAPRHEPEGNLSAKAFSWGPWILFCPQRLQQRTQDLPKFLFRPVPVSTDNFAQIAFGFREQKPEQLNPLLEKILQALWAELIDSLVDWPTLPAVIAKQLQVMWVLWFCKSML